MKNNFEEKEVTILDIVYNIIFSLITLTTIVLSTVPMFYILKTATEYFISIIGATNDSSTGPLILFFGMFLIPILIIAVLGCIGIYVSLIIAMVHITKRIKTRYARGYDCILFIIIFFINSLIEGFNFELKNIQYYLACIIEYGAMLEIILLIVILIMHRKQKKEKNSEENVNEQENKNND